MGLECYDVIGDPQFDPNLGRPLSDAPGYCRSAYGAAQLWIPIVGSFTFASSHPHDTFLNPHGATLSPYARAYFHASGAMQAAGLTLLLASATISDITVKKSAARLRLAPMRARRTIGMAITFDGW